MRRSGTARNSFPTEMECSKPRFILTYGIILVYRTTKVCSKVRLYCTSAVKFDFTAHFWSSINQIYSIHKFEFSLLHPISVGKEFPAVLDRRTHILVIY